MSRHPSFQGVTDSALRREGLYAGDLRQGLTADGHAPMPAAVSQILHPPKMHDIAEAAVVGFQVELHKDHIKLWVCVDGACVLRVNCARNLNVQIPEHPDYRFGKDLEE